jgi:hypothetical protein
VESAFGKNQEQESDMGNVHESAHVLYRLWVLLGYLNNTKNPNHMATCGFPALNTK